MVTDQNDKQEDAALERLNGENKMVGTYGSLHLKR